MRILLAEDESGVAQFIKKGLEEENYTIDVAVDGEEALLFVATQTYDLIILDVMLPKYDGFEVCTKIRQGGNSVPVLMLTARVAVKDKVQGLDSGADDYLTKPFSFDEFLARIRSLTRRQSSGMPELVVGTLRINLQSHRVFLEQHEIDLRPKEYGILEYMMRNKGYILSRTQILENVWGYDFDPSTNIVDVHIKSLRKKIAEFSEQKFIHTKRGMGYRIDLPEG
ncbi:MAG: DNA-binding response regulator [SAR324 cluster bacterium]|uniref:DNA-binding response regulator n=1 Tax=SAR324 cluster bacterium TaxID=2024889 RepID=A0A2A4SMA6_9DELT|nr:MAG: DNA-binding response regulator [SAR324 cluster bacterium]